MHKELFFFVFWGISPQMKFGAKMEEIFLLSKIRDSMPFKQFCYKFLGGYCSLLFS